MSKAVKVATTSEVPPGTGKVVQADGLDIALFNVEGTFFAIDNTCTHAGGPLSEGEMNGVEVTCPWHGGVFDVTTGEVLGPPPGRAVNRHNVRVDGSDIEVEL